MANEQQNRDITLAPDSYLFLQNVGKGGIITVYRGPAAVTQTGQDQPVRYDPNTRAYKQVMLEQAVCQCPRANEGDYVVLENPEKKDNAFPTETTQTARELKKGSKVVIPGPWSEALWPGQSATVVEGHRLRSNQYLIATVYNAEQAEKNWDQTVVKPQTDEGSGATSGQSAGATSSQGTTGSEPKPGQTTAKEVQQKGLPKPVSFAVGTRIVIRGSDVSFYIPCTGIEVARDENSKYVREAVTLEQLEYCCLIDESGKKEYPRGPKVVFPQPTQIFESDNKNRRKFRPIELNTINGIHLKVTADFEGPNIETDTSTKRKFEEGEELFVTGKTLSIYYPREELAIIEYGAGNKKHYSTAIPKGEGRYVINRETGEIGLITGPKMLLADPRYEIPVRRILSPDECSLWYPGNAAAIAYNEELALAMADSPSGRSGVVSEGDWRKRKAKMARGLAGGAGAASDYLVASAGIGSEAEICGTREEVGDEGGGAESIRRGTAYTQPRTLTLNTKFDGVPRIEIWPGYAVLIVGAEGSRKVVEGPEVVLLNYDEKLGFMELSTGKPKNTDKLFRTAYLGVKNNQVSDVVPFESKDHVKGNIKLSLRVSFEGETPDEKLRWFSVSNYVKYLCDHVRSIIAGMAKRYPVSAIKGDFVNLVREAILGAKPTEGQSESLRTSRPGLYFEDNGMRVVEVEVLDLTLLDATIAGLLDKAQHAVVQADIELEQQRRTLAVNREKEQIAQQTAAAQFETTQLKNKLQKEGLSEQIAIIAATMEVELKKLESIKEQTEVKEDLEDFTDQKRLTRAKAECDHQNAVDAAKLVLRKDELISSTNAAVARFNAAKEGLYEVMVSLGRDEMAAKLAEGCTIERWLSGDDVGSSISNLLSLAPTIKAFFDKAQTIQGPDGSVGKRNRLKSPEAVPAK